MIERRAFLKSSLCASASLLSAGASLADEKPNQQAKPKAEGSLAFQLTRDTPTRRFDGQSCWCHPRAGIVPDGGQDGNPRVVMTMNSLDLSGSDVFKGVFGLHTDDLSRTWTEPQELASLAPRYETIAGQERPVALSDFWPRWHAASKTLLGTGHTVVYTPAWKVTRPRPRNTSYSTYRSDKNQWTAWRKLEMPDGARFHDCGAGCTQRYDLADGSILLPMYFRPPGKNSRVIVSRCSFDGETLRHEEHGDALQIDDKTRGLHEPSLTRFGETFFLTLRNDRRGFITRSADGLQFEPIRPWTFDDGSDLGNYNTQQHWVTHSDGLFLVYTRRGANNDHVMRNRAPLFMAQVDPQRLCVIRETESILVPERGARLGNFGVTDVSPTETWVTVSEWMQPAGVEKRGSDGSVYVARLRWSKPNRLF